MEMVVQLCAEYDVPEFCDVNFTQQMSGIIQHGQQVGVAFADGMYQRGQVAVGAHCRVVLVDDTVQTHQCQDGMVGMVSDEFSLSCQAHTIYAVWFEDDDGEVGADADNHQRNEHVIATGDFCNEEEN